MSPAPPAGPPAPPPLVGASPISYTQSLEDPNTPGNLHRRTARRTHQGGTSQHRSARNTEERGVAAAPPGAAQAGQRGSRARPWHGHDPTRAVRHARWQARRGGNTGQRRDGSGAATDEGQGAVTGHPYAASSAGQQRKRAGMSGHTQRPSMQATPCQRCGARQLTQRGATGDVKLLVTLGAVRVRRRLLQLAARHQHGGRPARPWLVLVSHENRAPASGGAPTQRGGQGQWLRVAGAMRNSKRKSITGPPGTHHGLL